MQSDNKLFTFIKGCILLVFLWAVYQPAHAQADGAAAEPLGLILTWQQDPTSTMTIDWHTSDASHMPQIQFKKTDEGDWEAVQGEELEFPFSERIIRRVELTGLDPDTEYHFRFGENSRIRKFRTMPQDAGRPIRFAAGGDVRHRIEWMDQTNRQAAGYDPDFVIWGGDLAYANGQQKSLNRWYEFVESVMRTLVTADGRAVPVVVGVGNHEVLGGYYSRDEHDRRKDLTPYGGDDASRERIAPYYYKLFAFPGHPGYGVLDFGNYMSLLLLDTDHTNPMEGRQTEWLEEVLSERGHVPHIFPTYHVPGWPSVRNPEGDIHTRIRQTWVPLFEKHGVRVAFENHDHAYKRTHPIRGGKISDDGIVYLGDGAWGVGTRELGRSHKEHAWYLKRAVSERHFILGTIHGSHQHFLIVNEDGDIIDEYPRTPHVGQRNIRLASPWKEASDTENNKD